MPPLTSLIIKTETYVKNHNEQCVRHVTCQPTVCPKRLVGHTEAVENVFVLCTGEYLLGEKQQYLQFMFMLTNEIRVKLF